MDAIHGVLKINADAHGSCFHLRSPYLSRNRSALNFQGWSLTKSRVHGPKNGVSTTGPGNDPRWNDIPNEVLRLDKFHQPAGVDLNLAGLNMQADRIAPLGTGRLEHDADRRRAAGAVTGETVSKLCEQGKLSEAVEALGVLVQGGCRVSTSLFYCVLKRCVVVKDLVVGRRVHALCLKNGYEGDTFLGNHILRMYVSHARLPEAMDVFTLVAKPDAFMWSSIITAHVKDGQPEQAIQLYHQMRRSSVKPDGHVFVAALQACARGADFTNGQQVHADVLASGVEPDLFVSNCLVDMYAKCGSLEESKRVFDGLLKKDVVTWNAMIAGCSQQGKGQEALEYYASMQKEGFTVPSSVTFVCLLQACASVGVEALETGNQLHAQIEERGLQADVTVGNNLINMYAKCGDMKAADNVFNGLRQKDVVTWNTMIAGYVRQDRGQEALCLHSTMLQERTGAPNSVTFVCLLQACASLGVAAMEKGKELHAQIVEQGLQADVTVGNNLINMYAKCGSLEDAQIVFDGLSQKDVVTWTTLIAGYSQEGMGLESLRLYSAMQRDGIAFPDTVAFVCLLQVCANVAALHIGRQLHADIQEQGLGADLAVAIHLIKMYAKSGSMVDAQRVFDALPQRDVVAWSTLIAGYTQQGDSDVVFDLFHKMCEDGVQPGSTTLLSLLTVCSHVGLVDKGREYFDAMSRQYGISPTTEHYSCMVDLLGRAGQLDEALAVARTMPVQLDAAVWRTLLGACQKWRNVTVARCAFDEAVKVDETDAAVYVLMSNIYTSAEMWEKAQEMRVRRKGIGAWKQPGQSWWTDTDGLVHSFLVGVQKDSESDERCLEVVSSRKGLMYMDTPSGISGMQVHLSVYNILRHCYPIPGQSRSAKTQGEPIGETAAEETNYVTVNEAFLPTRLLKEQEALHLPASGYQNSGLASGAPLVVRVTADVAAMYICMYVHPVPWSAGLESCMERHAEQERGLRLPCGPR